MTEIKAPKHLSAASARMVPRSRGRSTRSKAIKFASYRLLARASTLRKRRERRLAGGEIII